MTEINCAQDFIQENPQEEFVMISGILIGEEKNWVFSDTHLFVFPPIQPEVHPKVLVEAIICGLPCVGSDCEGNRSLVISNETGLTFPVADSQALADQIRLVITQPDLANRLGNNARSHIVENFDLHSLLERETELLASLGRSKTHLA